jgi:hypothetical protein
MARRQSGAQPYLDHESLSQAEQARFLGAKPERTKNLGHDSTVDKLTENPVGYPLNYEPGSNRVVRGPPRSQGVYGKFRDPQSGICNQQNLDRWSGYARSNSFRGEGDSIGKDPVVRDPRGPHSNKSDGYLAPSPNPSTKNWADYRAGSESGEGRLEKLHGKR